MAERKEIGAVFFVPEVRYVGTGMFTLTVDADTLAGILLACKEGQEWMADCAGINETRWDALVDEIEANQEYKALESSSEQTGSAAC
jgi:hypothetical protein